MTYVIWHYIKVAHISLWYLAYLNFDEDIITTVPKVDTMSNLQKFQNWLGIRYINSQYETCKNDNALMYHVISKLFTITDSYCHVTQRKSIHDDQAVFCNTQAISGQRKLQCSYNDDKGKDRFVASVSHSKKQYTDVESPVDHGKVGLMMALKLTTFSKKLEALSWSQWSMLSRSN